jgi:hypothetical protein
MACRIIRRNINTIARHAMGTDCNPVVIVKMELQYINGDNHRVGRHKKYRILFGKYSNIRKLHNECRMAHCYGDMIHNGQLPCRCEIHENEYNITRLSLIPIISVDILSSYIGILAENAMRLYKYMAAPANYIYYEDNDADADANADDDAEEGDDDDRDEDSNDDEVSDDEDEEYYYMDHYKYVDDNGTLHYLMMLDGYCAKFIEFLEATLPFKYYIALWE